MLSNVIWATARQRSTRLTNQGLRIVDSPKRKGLLQNWRSHEKERELYFDAVDDCDSSMITAADAIKIIIEDSLFSVLEEDSNKTRPTG
jgi:hypothetical protein